MQPIVLTLAGVPAIAPTRAGGGHNSGGSRSVSRSSGSSHSSSHSSGGYSSGGYSSGSGTGYYSTGHSGGGGASFGMLFLLVVVILVIIGISAAVRKNRSGFVDSSEPYEGEPDEWPSRTLRSGPTPQFTPPLPGGVTPSTQAGLDRIKAHDPNFDQHDFQGKAADAFFLVEKAWTDLDPSLSRRVMDNGIWVRHKGQMDELQSLGKRNVLEDLSIQSSRIIEADSTATEDTITVRFTARCKDYDIDVASGKVVRGDPDDLGEWDEDWVFQRSSKAVTRDDGGTLAQKCPVCGAPLDPTEEGTCKYCKTMVMAGEQDWVLTRIEQVMSPAQ